MMEVCLHHAGNLTICLAVPISFIQMTIIELEASIAEMKAMLGQSKCMLGYTYATE